MDEISFLLKRAAFVDHRRHRAVHASCRGGVEAPGRGGRCALVVGCEFLEVEWFSGVALDAPYDALAADGAVVGDVIVHAAVLLGAEYAPVVHVASFEDIYNVAVAGVEDEMAPAYFVHLSGERYVVVPA